MQVVNRGVFADLPDDMPLETIHGVYKPLIESGRVRVFPVDATFYDIGTPEDYAETCQAFERATR